MNSKDLEKDLSAEETVTYFSLRKDISRFVRKNKLYANPKQAMDEFFTKTRLTEEERDIMVKMLIPLMRMTKGRLTIKRNKLHLSQGGGERNCPPAHPKGKQIASLGVPN